jgi:hypothetical protein
VWRPCLDYATALANGWPIATGVVEGLAGEVSGPDLGQPVDRGLQHQAAFSGVRWSVA